MDDVPTVAKGIMGMKFMQDAVARAEREAASMADETRLELLGIESDPADDIGDEVVSGNLGRRVYKPGQVKPAQTYSDISSTLKDSESTNSPTDTITPLPAASASQSPALAPTIGSASITGKIARKSNATETTKMQKLQAKSEAERSKAREDAVVEIDMTQAMTLSDAQVNQQKTKQNGQGDTQSAKVDSAYQDSEDEGSDVDERAPTAFKQRELVAMAFAGDNVIEDFAVEKQRVIQEDAPKEVDTTLPGWGSWGGRGTKKSAPRPSLIKKIAGVDATKRADAGKSHVIISERKDKKAAKYLVKDLPYPYTSKEQFARSMATPIGAEWNTRVAHQRATLPRVVKKKVATFKQAPSRSPLTPNRVKHSNRYAGTGHVLVFMVRGFSSISKGPLPSSDSQDPMIPLQVQAIVDANGGFHECITLLKAHSNKSVLLALPMMLQIFDKSLDVEATAILLTKSNLYDYQDRLADALESKDFTRFMEYSSNDFNEDSVANPFTRPYVGPAADLLFCYLREFDENFSTSSRGDHAEMCSIFQSSGVGKSRTILQLKENNVIVVYMKIREYGRSKDGPPYLLRDDIPADILTKTLDCPEDEYSDRCIAFFVGLFMVVAKHLEGYSAQYHSRQQIARAWSNDMCELKCGVRRTRFFMELKRCYKAGGGTPKVTRRPPFLDLVSFILIYDKAKKRGSGFTLYTDWLESANLPQPDQPYVAIVADLGLGSQEAVFTLDTSSASPVLKIHAPGIGRTTYPHLTDQMVEPLRGILAEPIKEEPNQEMYTEASKRLDKQLRYGSSSKNAGIVWENNKWSFSM
ncbi:U3 small nucleolar RNA-associated protein 14 [Ceratobasidium sp. AG-Ba]|nr:U3 small nucleolar RNA-associated protein 14 [Ceratobasidium sp. AG-Ba]